MNYLKGSAKSTSVKLFYFIAYNRLPVCICAECGDQGNCYRTKWKCIAWCYRTSGRIKPVRINRHYKDFSITIIPGNYTLVISSAEQSTQRSAITITEGQTITRDIVLSNNTTLIQSVVEVGTRNLKRTATEPLDHFVIDLKSF